MYSFEINNVLSPELIESHNIPEGMVSYTDVDRDNNYYDRRDYQYVLLNPDDRMYCHERTEESDLRLSVLDAVIQDCNKQLDCIIGATVFGSTMKGTAHSKSDIDAFIFIDSRAIEDNETSEVVDLSGLASAVRSETDKKLSLYSDNRNDIRVVSMSRPIIEDSIKGFVDYEAFYKKEVEARQEKIQILRDEYLDSHVDESESYTLEVMDAARLYVESVVTQEPKSPMLNWEICALFYPVVGNQNQIKSLRRDAICVIEQYSNANEIWYNISSSVDTFAYDEDDSDIEMFPHCFATAKKIFV